MKIRHNSCQTPLIAVATLLCSCSQEAPPSPAEAETTLASASQSRSVPASAAGSSQVPSADSHQSPAAPRWWKGNTHTHTYWSDGNAAPEQVIDWYARNDYHFLVLSDHNILSTVDKWFPIGTSGSRPLTPQHVAALEERFGPGWVEHRTTPNGAQQMRLKTLPELRAVFDKPEQFTLIQGEEITDSFRRVAIHINALNIDERIEPQGGESVQETIQRTMDAIAAQGKRLNKPVLGHLNHPNYLHSLTPEDVASIRGERFFEVYNGHRGVLNHGDEDGTVDTETIWDVANTLRLTELKLDLLYALATDDSHDHHGVEGRTSMPGRGWVHVLATELTPDAIITAMRSGAFYASSGVTLGTITSSSDSLALTIEPQDGVTFTTQFIGTRMNDDAPRTPGEILATSTDMAPAYTMRGDELYVRARVVSSREHPNPFAPGDMQTAWVQPIRGPAAPPMPRN